jgi:hypothetical protein
MYKLFEILFVLLLIFAMGCIPNHKKTVHQKPKIFHPQEIKIVVDCDYTFAEAIEGCKAPASILDELKLIDVEYFSTDGKVHRGQILTNKKMVSKLEIMFRYMKQMKFPVARAIPIVKYDWNDDLSMKENNTYSFCYRNIGYSKHAKGMAIDINPFFNPMRWKEGYTFRHNKPEGATCNPSVSGTFYESNQVVLEFRKNGMRWGHTFSRKFDDHHFEM